MKKLLIIGLMLSSIFTIGKSNNLQNDLINSNPDSLQIVTTQELRGLLESTLDNYRLSGSEDAISVDVISSENLVLTKKGQLGFKSDLVIGNPSPYLWSVTIGRDILVAVTAKSNPYLAELRESGIKPSAYSSILKGESRSWASVLESNVGADLELLCTDLDFAKEHLSALTGLAVSDLRLNKINTSSDIVADLSANKRAIGFCRLTDILNKEQNEINENLEVIPVDINENGLTDHFENYTGSYAELSRAVWIGKYPKSMYKELKLIAIEKPSSAATLAFVEWMLTGAQNGLYTAELTELQYTERRTSLNNLLVSSVETSEAGNYVSAVSTGLYWVIGIFFALILAGVIVMFTYGKSDLQIEKIISGNILDEGKLTAPAGLLFDKSHTWTFMERSGAVKVGLADFMQHVTGKISRIEFKNIGETVKRGQAMFTIIQDGKHLVIKSPVSGKIESINKSLESDSNSINNSPYTEGWVYEVQPDNWMAEYSNFLIGKTYSKWLHKEIVRLKEFLSSAVFKQQTSPLQVVMLDGGEIQDNLLESLSPELWEEFQLGYIDKAK